MSTEVAHMPAAEVDGCTTCHGAHSTRNLSLLLQPVSETCLGCHDGDSTTFADKHLGLPAASIDCASCHDPHASRMAGMLLPNTHAPFAEGDCSTCHEEAPKEDGP